MVECIAKQFSSTFAFLVPQKTKELSSQRLKTKLKEKPVGNNVYKK